MIDQFKGGIIDIHNHLLPSLDDGASTIDDTIKMIELMKTCNISAAIATPHIMEDFYDLNSSKIENSFNLCKQDLKKKGLSNFLIGCASEYMIDHHFVELLNKNDFMYLKDKLLLTELSYFQKPVSLLETVFNLKMQGITPILAHPERYRYIKELSEFKTLKEKGFLFQMNLLSINGYYGKDAFAKAKMLLDNNMFDFIGTDAHRHSHLIKLKETYLSKHIINKIAAVIDNHQSYFN